MHNNSLKSRLNFIINRRDLSIKYLTKQINSWHSAMYSLYYTGKVMANKVALCFEELAGKSHSADIRFSKERLLNPFKSLHSHLCVA